MTFIAFAKALYYEKLDIFFEAIYFSDKNQTLVFYWEKIWVLKIRLRAYQNFRLILNCFLLCFKYAKLKFGNCFIIYDLSSKTTV